MKIYKHSILLIILCSVLFLSTVSYAADNYDFIEDEFGKSYIKDGKNALYWHKIDDQWYYFGEDGRMVVGWQYIDPKKNIGYFEGDDIPELAYFPQWFYFNEDGALTKKGWKYLPIKHETNINKKYKEPIAEIGLPYKWFYFNDKGHPASNWVSVNNSWYYLSDLENNYGEMQMGWLNYNGTWYYLTGSGAMKTDWLNYNGAWYYLAESGAMKTGWLNYNGTWYYLTGSGAMKTGWLKYNGDWYYLNDSGDMLVGTHTVNGEVYTFDDSGALMDEGECEK